MTIISKDIAIAKQLLDDQQVVAVPTETVYGLAANALSVSAINKIFSVKQRPPSNPLILHIADKSDVAKYARTIHPIASKLMDAFWPGPLTILFEKNENVPTELTSGLPKVAIRMPNHPLLLSLLKTLNYPLAAPSANLFGKVSPTKAQHVKTQLGEKIPLILDGGECTCGLESTIVGIEDNELKIFRLGFITEEQIKNALGDEVNVVNYTHSKPVAPGMLPYHYSTNTPLFLVDDVEMHIEKHNQKVLGVISFSKPFTNVSHAFTLSVSGSLEESAKQLYATLNYFDTLNLDLILCEKFPDYGLGKTINDRLTKASNKHHES